MNVSRITAALVASTSLVLVSPALAQFDPEAGDTGEWTPPPAQQPNEQPPAEQPPQQQPPAQQPPAQQPPPANNNWQQAPAQQQPSWFNNGQEQPPSVGQPATPAAPEAPVTPGDTDHSQVSLGVTFFGLDSLTVEPNGVPGREDADNLSIRMPAVGVRYWVSETIGLDIGIGLGIVTSEDFNDCVVDAGTCSELKVGGIDGGFGLRFHFGLPIALKTYEHFNILLTPEVGFQYGQATFFNPVDPALDVDVSAFAIDVGAKIGGELQFGFWGVPNLALQANIGLGLRYASRSGENTVAVDNPAVYASSSTDLSLRTIADDLAGTIRLVYYIQ